MTSVQTSQISVFMLFLLVYVDDCIHTNYKGQKSFDSQQQPVLQLLQKAERHLLLQSEMSFES